MSCSLEMRLTWTYKRSGLAMLITSATTMAAFLCTTVSPLASTASFGIFAALVILCDYVLVMTFFCTTMVVYHNHIEGRKCGAACGAMCCYACRRDPAPGSGVANGDGAAAEESGGGRTAAEMCKSCDVAGALARVFSHDFAELILNRRARLAIAVAAVAWLIPAIVFAAKTEPTEQAQQFLPVSDAPCVCCDVRRLYLLY